MRTSVTEIGPNKFRLAVEVEVEEVSKLLDRTYKRLAGEIRVPGFRPGKVPKPIIDQRLGRDFVRNEALRDGLPALFADAVRESDLDVVAPPEIDVTSFEDGQDLTFEATVEVRPTPTLTGWEGLEIKRPRTDIRDDEVTDLVERLRERYASLEVVERPIKEGDYVQVDLNTYRHDVVVEDATAKDLMIRVGAEMIVPELDSELQGKRKGDILKITAELPERFGDRAGWQVGMTVLVKEVKAPKLPELDDELAKTVSEFDTLDELRADLRDRLERTKRQNAESAVRERVLDAFVERGVEVELPEGMVAMEIDRQVRQMARLLASRNASIEQYLESENIDVDAFRERIRPQAERNLAVGLGLQALAESQGLEVSEEDRQAEIANLAASLGREPDEVREMLESGGDVESLTGDILRTKALDLLVERAQITEEDEG